MYAIARTRRRPCRGTALGGVPGLRRAPPARLTLLDDRHQHDLLLRAGALVGASPGGSGRLDLPHRRRHRLRTGDSHQVRRRPSCSVCSASPTSSARAGPRFAARSCDGSCGRCAAWSPSPWAVFTFLAFDPLVRQYYGKFRSDIKDWVTDPLTGVIKPAWVSQFADVASPRLYWFTNLMWWGFGPALEIVGLDRNCLAGFPAGQAGGGRGGVPSRLLPRRERDHRAIHSLPHSAGAGAGALFGRALRRPLAATAMAVVVGGRHRSHAPLDRGLCLRLHERLSTARQPSRRVTVAARSRARRCGHPRRALAQHPADGLVPDQHRFQPGVRVVPECPEARLLRHHVARHLQLPLRSRGRPTTIGEPTFRRIWPRPPGSSWTTPSCSSTSTCPARSMP